MRREENEVIRGLKLSFGEFFADGKSAHVRSEVLLRAFLFCFGAQLGLREDIPPQLESVDSTAQRDLFTLITQGLIKTKKGGAAWNPHTVFRGSESR